MPQTCSTIKSKYACPNSTAPPCDPACSDGNDCTGEVKKLGTITLAEDICVHGESCSYEPRTDVCWASSSTVCYYNGNTNPDYSCLQCDNNTWAIKPGYCLIDNACYADDDTRPDHACQVCSSSISNSTWSPILGYCLLNDECYSTGTVHPNISCLECDSNSQWAVSSTFCYISGECVPSDGLNPDNNVHFCTTFLVILLVLLLYAGS